MVSFRDNGQPIVRVRSESLNVPFIYRVSIVYLPCMYRKRQRVDRGVVRGVEGRE